MNKPGLIDCRIDEPILKTDQKRKTHQQEHCGPVRDIDFIKQAAV